MAAFPHPLPGSNLLWSLVSSTPCCRHPHICWQPSSSHWNVRPMRKGLSRGCCCPSSPGQCLAHSSYSPDSSRMVASALGPLYATPVIISTLVSKERELKSGEVNSQTHERRWDWRLVLCLQLPCSRYQERLRHQVKFNIKHYIIGIPGISRETE